MRYQTLLFGSAGNINAQKYRRIQIGLEVVELPEPCTHEFDRYLECLREGQRLEGLLPVDPQG